MVDIMLKGTISVLVLLGMTTQLSLARQANDPFAGSFANEGIVLTLQATGQGYNGHVQFEGQAYAVVAQVVNGGILQGTYTYQGQPIPFQAARQGDNLIIASEGERFMLQVSNTAIAASTTTTSTGGANPAAQPGEVYNPDWGIRFKAPQGWTGQPQEGGYLFVSNTQKGFVMVIPHEATTVAEIRTEAQQGLVEPESQTQLMLEGATEDLGSSGVAGTFGGTLNGTAARARVIGIVSPHGKGAMIMAATEKDAYTDEYAQLADDMARSITFSKPETTPLVQEWKEFLYGCRLSYFNSYDSGYGGGGYIDEATMDLCPGYFSYGDHSETVFNQPDLSGSDVYLSSGGKGAGQWTVIQQGQEAILQLLYHDGSVKSYTLGYEDGKTYLNGSRWLRTCNPNDQVVEARPQCY